MTRTGPQKPRGAALRAATRRRSRMRFGVFAALTLAMAGIVAVLVMNGSFANNDAGATTWSASAYTGGPRLAVDRTLVDKGPVDYGHEVDATYRLKNVGDQPLSFQPPTVETVEGC